MRKLKLITLFSMLVMSTLGAFAQFTNGGSKFGNNSKIISNFDIKYQGDVELSLLAGSGTSLSFGTTQGVMVGEYFFAGGSLFGEVSTNDFGWWNIAPMVTLRAYYPLMDDCRVFFNQGLGASIGVSGKVKAYGFEVKNNGSAFEFRSSVGVQYLQYQASIGCAGISKSTCFLLSLGYVF